MYIIVKQGVYIQGVYGPFQDGRFSKGLEDAKKAANKLAASEPDDYHTFDVYELRKKGLGKHVYTVEKSQI